MKKSHYIIFALSLILLFGEVDPNAQAHEAVSAGSSAMQTIAAARAEDRFKQARDCLEYTTASQQSAHDKRQCENSPKSCNLASTDALDAWKKKHLAQSSLNCPSEDPNVAEAEFRSAVNDAAANGSYDAQVCFIQGAFRLDSKLDVQNYRRLAMQYIKAGLGRGDWRVVYLLGTPMESVGHYVGALTNISIIGKPITVYRATQLMMLGASPEYRKQLSYQLELPSRYLSPNQIKSAESWARKEFSEHFRNSPQLNGAPSICE